MPINYSKYPPDWKETVERIRKRSGDKCEICGLKNHSFIWSVPFFIREVINNHTARYRLRRVWFRHKGDAIRENGGDEGIKKVKVILTVAHLDHDETNHKVSDDRLLHLCQACHLRYDAQEKFRRILEKSKKRFREIQLNIYGT